MTGEIIPEWAMRRAYDLTPELYRPFGGVDFLMSDNQGHGALRAFARYIAAHEEAPVDPLLLEAREIVASQYEKEDDGVVRHYLRPDGWILSGDGMDIAKQYRDGKCDDKLTITLTALRRGIEIAGETP